jgi:hypothetical protein
MARLDEQLVQVQRIRRISGSERDDAGDLPGAASHEKC